METEKNPARTSLPKTGLPRVYRIDAKIASGGYPNSEELAEMCETSLSTIWRDIEFMKSQLLAPIKYDRFRRGYYYTQKTYRLPGGFTSAEDLLALGMAKNILSLYRETPLYEPASSLLEGIIAPLASDGNKGWLEDRIVVPKVASAKVDLSIWETVISGIKGNRIITFEYLGSLDDEYQNRRVRPYQLLFDSGMWYLYGFAEERKAVRIFSLSRMQNAVLSKDRFSLPPKFKYDDSAGDSYFGVFIGEVKHSFAIDCFDDAVLYASERQWAGDQAITEIEGGVSLEFTSTQSNKVLQWVLSCGINVIPRKPQSLVDAWKAHAREMGRLARKA